MPTNSPFAADGTAIGTDGSISVPLLLNQPRRILRDVLGVASANYILGDVLSNGGSTSGGAVVFDIAQPAEEFLDRDVQEIGELSQFPLLNGDEPIPAIKRVVKVGGKLLFSDEKRDRNDMRFMNREQTKLGNTMADKVERLGVAAITEAITQYSRTTPAASAWADVVSNGTGETPYTEWPHADLARARAAGRVALIGGVFDVLLIHPNDYVTLEIIYDGQPQRFWGGTAGTFVQTTTVPEGSPILAARGQAGGTYWEKMIGIETWREPEIEGTFVQTSGRMVHVVDNPYALLQLTGV
jgi:hypothetical protein